MGQIADIIKNGYDGYSMPAERTEKKIKSAIAELGRGLIRELNKDLSDCPTNWTSLTNRIAGVKELMRRVQKM